MKRQRRANGGSADLTDRPAVVLQAASAAGTKTPSLDASPRHAAAAGPDGRVWARYIDSRMKQFGTR
jgi:hypothetical protein